MGRLTDYASFNEAKVQLRLKVDFSGDECMRCAKKRLHFIGKVNYVQGGPFNWPHNYNLQTSHDKYGWP